ncbi:MAG: hypothetical protein J3K34DRAFT_32421 [Monoraphidium minutum]|nr:MAG: hypothetical protein J3K34DRAFT_32421 [Monoraphidium minutum]
MYGSDPYSRALPSYGGSGGGYGFDSSPYTSYSGGGSKARRRGGGGGGAAVSAAGAVLALAMVGLLWGLRGARHELEALSLRSAELDHSLIDERNMRHHAEAELDSERRYGSAGAANTQLKYDIQRVERETADARRHLEAVAADSASARKHIQDAEARCGAPPARPAAAVARHACARARLAGLSPAAGAAPCLRAHP